MLKKLLAKRKKILVFSVIITIILIIGYVDFSVNKSSFNNECKII